jgi:hypothetical protein
MSESRAAKKTVKKVRIKGRAQKHMQMPIKYTLIEQHYTQKYIVNTLFNFSQDVLFHPHIYTLFQWGFPSLIKGVKPPTSITSTWSALLVRAAVAQMPKLMKMKRIFRKFLHLWRYKRLCVANDTDPATLEIPVKPVYIVDWSAKSSMVFEASTLVRDITSRLMNHDGLFDTCQVPRNPYTNLPLTQAQTISIWNQISYYAVPLSTAFTAFRQARWDYLKFTRDYAVVLKLNAFRKTMRNPLHIDYMERMKDFIQYVYDYESVSCNMTNYNYALYYKRSHPLLKKWARLCTEYYETHILYGETSDIFISARDRIIDKAVELIYRDSELRSI